MTPRLVNQLRRAANLGITVNELLIRDAREAKRQREIARLLNDAGLMRAVLAGNARRNGRQWTMGGVE